MRHLPLGLVLCLLCPLDLRAEPTSEVFGEGVRLRRQGNDEAALQIFGRAYEKSPSPRLLVQIGLAEQALGRWGDARRHLVEALHQSEDRWVEERRQVIEASVRDVEAHLGALVVESNVQGAELWLDGVHATPLPMEPLYRDPGAVRIEVRGPNREPTSLNITLEAGRTTYVRLPLETPTPKIPAHRESVPQTCQAWPVASSTPVLMPNSVPTRSPSWLPTQRTAAWMTATAGALLIAGAAVANIEREHLISKYRTPSLCNYGGLSPEERCGSYRADAQLFQALAIVGYAAGGAAALASAVLFLTGQDEGSAIRAGGAITPSGGFAYLSGFLPID